MTDNAENKIELELLRPEVREATRIQDAANHDLRGGSWWTVRAELLRLARENADASAETITGWRNRALDAEFELDRLTHRIAEAPESSADAIIGGWAAVPIELRDARIALVKLEDGE